MTAEPDAASRPPRARDANLSLYAELSRRVQTEGLQRRRYGYYWTCFALAFTAFVGIWVGVAVLRDSWFQLLLAAALALVSAQLGFLGHDAAHRQVFRSARWNEWSARVVSGALTGLSYGWWIHKHNRHHSGPNQVDRDPDIAPGVIAFTPELAHARRGAAAAFTRRQGWWFFLLLPFEGLNLHVQSVRTLLGRAPVRLRAVEAVFLAVRLGGYLAAVFALLPPGKAAAFVAVQLGLFGVLLGGAFAPNHIGMPIVPAGTRPDFLRRQVLMSRNITGGPVIGFLMGGLNHQIEHHLFPNMPRPGLKRARSLVRDYCLEHHITYTESNLRLAYAAIVRYLNTVGLRDRDPFRCPIVALYR
jgi:fatty acid desaturase